jgi:hypothetical protein
MTTESPKLKIATTITHTERVDKDIELPYYFKDCLGCSCKIVNDHFLISVDIENNFWAIKTSPVSACGDRIAKGTPISQDEYDAAYSKAMMYVDIINRNEDPSGEHDENVQIDEMIYNQR